jgi:hypothetical protein
VFGILAGLTKAPFFFCVGLTSFFLLLGYGRQSVRRWFLLGSVGVMAIIVFALWMHRNQSIWSRAEFPLVDPSLGGSTGTLSHWYFGDLQCRFDPSLWLRGAWDFSNYELGGLVLIAVLGGGLLCAGTRLARLWYLAGFVTIVVFPLLFVWNKHYYLVISPATAMFCAAACQVLENHLMAGRSHVVSHLFVLAAAIVLALNLVQWLFFHSFTMIIDTFPQRMAATIRLHTAPEDKLVLYQSHGGWETANALFLSDRRGLAIWNTQLLSTRQNVARLRELGFNKLVLMNCSRVYTPRLLQAQDQRWSYHADVTPTIQRWPTVLETDDILIKDIPKQ